MKRFAELYLLTVRGGYTLASLVALVLNMRTIYTSEYRVETQDLRDLNDNLFLLLGAAAALIAGLAIRKYRWWGLVLAPAIGIIAIVGALAGSQIDAYDYHNFTIALPLTVILIWAILPPTWAEFKRHSVTVS